jgi:hypothetical protein
VADKQTKKYGTNTEGNPNTEYSVGVCTYEERDDQEQAGKSKRRDSGTWSKAWLLRGWGNNRLRE